MLALIILVVFAAAMLHAAITDMLSMTIANRVSLALVAGFAVLAPLAGMEWQSVGFHLAAGLVVLVATFALFAAGAMGGGDAKLLAATSVWMGFGPVLFDYVFVSAIAGGILTALILVYRRTRLASATGHYPLLRNFADSQKGIPYGVALGFGGLYVLPQAPLTAWALARLVG